MKQVHLLIIVYILVFTACKKSNEPGQAISPVKNIMSCKVNGVQHTYEGIPTYLNHEGVTYAKYENDDATEYSIAIRGDNNLIHNDNISIRIYTWDIELDKKYPISNENRKDYGEYIYDGNKVYKTGLNSGYIIYTQCSEALIEGNFAFTAYTPDGQKVEITDGYFNIDRSE